MKTVAFMLAVSLAPLSAAPIGQGERDFALSSLHASRKMFLDSIAGLTPAQWTFKPAPDRWSIAEVAEHLVVTEDEMRMWEQKTLAKPATTPSPDARSRDQEIYRQMLDRGAKREKAPKSLTPTGQFKTPEAAADAFRAKRDATLDYVRTTQDDLRGHVGGSGENVLDVYQLILVTAAHTERHVEQINEVKADPKYPK